MFTFIGFIIKFYQIKNNMKAKLYELSIINNVAWNK